MKPCPSIAAIQAGVARQYRVRVLDLVSARREQRLVWPRFVAMYLCRELTAHSLPAIGRHFGDRDHTSISYALRRVAQRMERDLVEAAAIQALRRDLAARVALRTGSGERQAILDSMAALLARRKILIAELEGIEKRLDQFGALAWGGPEGAGEGRKPGAGGARGDQLRARERDGA